MYRWLKEENILPLHETLFRNVIKYPERTALDYFDRTISYRELWRQIVIFAHIFKKLGVNKGDVVGIFSPNIPQFVFGYYAASLLGAVVAPVNYFLAAGELLHNVPMNKVSDKAVEAIRAQLAEAKPKVLLVADVFYGPLSRIKEETENTRVIFTSPAEFLPPLVKGVYWLQALRYGNLPRIPKRNNFYSTHVLFEMARKEKCEECIPEFGGDANEIAQLQYTTGTSGEPKGTLLSHKNLVSNVWQCREHMGDALGDSEITLGALPFFHVYGLTVCLHTTLIGIGGTLVLLPKFSPKKATKLLLKKKVTVFAGTNRMFKTMIPLLKKSFLKICTSGAGRLDDEVKKDFEEKAGVIIQEGYGQTEASPVISIAVSGDKTRNVGRFVPGTEGKIIGEESRELPVGEQGEIVVSGPQVMRGYFKKSEKTEEKLTDGWLHTGDVGYLDSSGNLHLVDRLDDMTKKNGEWLAPAPIEEYLLQKSAGGIKKCLVIFVDDERNEKAIIAFVVFAEGFGIAELREMEKSIPALWALKEVVEVDNKTFAAWEDALDKKVRKKAREYYVHIKK